MRSESLSERIVKEIRWATRKEQFMTAGGDVGKRGSRHWNKFGSKLVPVITIGGAAQLAYVNMAGRGCEPGKSRCR